MFTHSYFRNRVGLQLAAWSLAMINCSALALGVDETAPDRPNILWITSEDNGPQLGAYGDTYANTPALDRFASQGVTYLNASSNAPVCAPARSTLITGMYAPSIGSQHMRCRATLPDGFRLFPAYLRDAGYYCTNNSKTDYNLQAPDDTWDASGRNAHWRNRDPDQPFFSVFNITLTHESRVWPQGDGLTDHNPAAAPIPPYHPDTTTARRDWAQYYDNMTRLDLRVGQILDQLEADGLADDTIVFYYADHGPGMPRGKRWLYQSGLHVPLIIRFPEKFSSLAPARPNSTSERLVSFVDFGPTALSLAGIALPDHMQGQPFLGDQATDARKYTFGYRDRMDERIDLSRSVFDGRYKYIRNYMPHRPQSQYLQYMHRMPTMVQWRQLFEDGSLSADQAAFFMPKPIEELYDVHDDPHEVNNLANSPEHASVLTRMRSAHEQWAFDIVDTGFMPEAELRARSAGRSEFETIRDNARTPFRRMFDAADLVGRADDGVSEFIAVHLEDADPAVRYWASLASLALDRSAVQHGDLLKTLIDDPSPCVRVAAAEALFRFGERDLAMELLIDALSQDSFEVRLQAAIALDELDQHARPALPAMLAALKANPASGGGMNHYVGRVLERALDELGESSLNVQQDGPFQATGIRICEIDSDSAIIWTRLTQSAQRVGSDAPLPVVSFPMIEPDDPNQEPRRSRTPNVDFPDDSDIDTIQGATPGAKGQVRVRYRRAGAQGWQATPWRDVDPDRDYTAHIALAQLDPASEYQMQVQSRADRDAQPGQTIAGRFRTAPLLDQTSRVLFTVSTGQAYGDQDVANEKGGGYRIYDAMRGLSPNFFVHTGDIVYYDKLAKSIPLARWHWARTYSLPTNTEFHRLTPSYFMKDDHDTWINDCWPTMNAPRMGEFTFADGQAIFLEQVGMGDKTYRTIRWGKDLQIWLVEGRDFRSPNNMPDGPDKTIWGKEQMDWFKQTVEESDATFRVLLSPTPVVGPDRTNKRDNHANAGFTHEGDQLRTFIASQQNMFVVCGDRHWQYISVDEATGVREYSCGPASNKHAGGWSNNRVLPEHRYLNVTGGFLAGIVERVEGEPRLTFRHYSVDGVLLNEDVLNADGGN